MNLNDDSNPNRYIYNTKYTDENLSLYKDEMLPYDREMINIRLETMRKYGTGKRVLDLCCGTGAYLRHDWGLFHQAIGLDFSSKMLNIFLEKLDGNRPDNLLLLECDARQVALRSESVDFVFSFASLYHVPKVVMAIKEIGRVLKPGGIAAFELGNLWSLNTFISQVAHRKDGIAKPFHISYPAMLRMIREANLKIIEQRAFQILPMWGPRPIWVRPLANWRWWKRLMGLKARGGGRMLDEWISSLRPMCLFAFRYLFVCQKE